VREQLIEILAKACEDDESVNNCPPLCVEASSQEHKSDNHSDRPPEKLSGMDVCGRN